MQARPKHWLKNVFILVPIAYARHMLVWPSLLLVAQCFAAFCLISSAVYTFNDILDADMDRLHPTKCRRPIASGKITKKAGAVYSALLFLAGFSLTVIGQKEYMVALFAAVYALINVAYSLWLKHVAVADCFCIAAGFVLRIYAGGAQSGDAISEWLLLTMTAISLFMAFGKRRGEMMQLAAQAAEPAASRRVLESYHVDLLHGIVYMCAGLSVVFYALWSMDSGSRMVYTVPLVIFIVCKYLQVLHSGANHGDPASVILGNKALMASAAVFALLTVALLYL